jgi:hypothetical protein
MQERLIMILREMPGCHDVQLTEEAKKEAEKKALAQGGVKRGRKKKEKKLQSRSETANGNGTQPTKPSGANN